MTHVTTHILDATAGTPAAGVDVSPERIRPDDVVIVSGPISSAMPMK